jgi:microcompartment protein CcmL/EutN
MVCSELSTAVSKESSKDQRRLSLLKILLGLTLGGPLLWVYGVVQTAIPTVIGATIPSYCTLWGLLGVKVNKSLKEALPKATLVEFLNSEKIQEDLVRCVLNGDTDSVKNAYCAVDEILKKIITPRLKKELAESVSKHRKAVDNKAKTSREAVSELQEFLQPEIVSIFVNLDRDERNLPMSEIRTAIEERLQQIISPESRRQLTRAVAKQWGEIEKNVAITDR